MLVKHHVMVSLGGGAIIYLLTQSLLKAGLFGLAGIFIDLDHLFDYVANYGWKMVGLKEFNRVFNKCELKKIYIILHAYEIWVSTGILLWYLKPNWGGVVFLSLTIHFIMDHIYFFTHFRPNSPWIYFLLYRLSKGFAVDKFRKKQ